MTAATITLPVVETFASIQGESTHAGRLCFFIRLAGCNLACSYCDTVYAQNCDCGTPIPLEELVEAARRSGLDLVEITGGEPALHPQTPTLAKMLLDAGFEVLMETNGSILLDKFPSGVKRIVDVKLPSSGMSATNEPGNYQLLKSGDELKFVTASKEDFLWALDWIDRWELDKKGVPLLFSAVFGEVELPELVQWILDSKRNYLRFQLQMHKFIWPPDMRGV
jgi:7-carboxy-7-deazaguanine synthase